MQSYSWMGSVKPWVYMGLYEQPCLVYWIVQHELVTDIVQFNLLNCMCTFLCTNANRV